jgi:hypothetical protein
MTADLEPVERVAKFCQWCGGRRITPRRKPWYYSNKRKCNPEAVKACEHKDCPLWSWRLGSDRTET